MKNVLPKYLVILLLLIGISIFFVHQIQAAVNYSNSNGNFTISFDNNEEDFSNCAGNTYWRINLSYDSGTEVQGSVRSTETLSGTDSFDIADETPIQTIELWAGSSEEDASTGACRYGIADDAGGLFNWDAGATISDILVSNVTSSSVTVSWTTSEAADSTVYYGTTSSYGSTATDGTATTSHSVSLTGLSASSTYHYKVKSGVTESGDNTFATPETGTTGSNQSGTTTTITATPTPTPIPDTTPPAVSIDTNLSKPFLKPPTISGKASDASGILKVEYSVDDGKNWNAVDEIPNLGAKFVAFTFTPPPLDDDNYKVRIRATDNAPAKNVRISEAFTLIIDRLPPAIGGNIIALGPQILFPNSKGFLLTSKGAIQKMTLAAAGGPTQIDLYAYPTGATTSAKKYPLTHNSDNGLWSTNLQFDNPGIYQLLGKSVDGAGNTTERQLNKIVVLEPGVVMNKDKKPIKDAKVTLYYFENKYQIWREWNAKAYNQTNPIKTNAKGEFSYLVPSGKYYFDIKDGGLIHSQSEIFTVDNPTVLNPTFSLNSLQVLFDFWIFKLYLPHFSTETVPVAITVPSFPQDDNTLIGKVATDFTLPTTDGNQFSLSATRGTALVLTFLNKWSPQANEQLVVLDRLTGSTIKDIPIMIGDSFSKIEIFKKKGEYKTSLVVDSDGKSV